MFHLLETFSNKTETNDATNQDQGRRLKLTVLNKYFSKRKR